MPSPDLQLDAERYEILRALGKGGAGMVFLARDRETGEQLALKKLQRIDHKSVLRFKREFRSLANMHHPNLVRLYDLGNGPDGWFLTMELIQGRALDEELLAARDVHQTRATRSHHDDDVAFFARVVALFAHLAAGVRAIHHAGMLHRDLKPSNVMVAHDGRVVVLDFGLVRDLEGGARGQELTQDGSISGTPAYMAPEQASTEPLSEASDWYAFGAMLYEMLSGRLPIEGKNIVDLLTRKLSEDPAPLAEEASLPSALRELCMQLVRRDPRHRPDGAQISAVLGSLMREPELRERTLSEELVSEIAQSAASPLFGREAETAQLRQALERSGVFETVVAHVRGTSGAGKSALVEHFLDQMELTRSHQALVLRGRCYEREAMPFKALDGVIDALVAHISQLDPVSAAHLLPTAISDLTRLFPVFERLPVVSRLIGARATNVEAAEARRHADQALQELIGRVASEKQLVIWIDDLQWGDLDSARVIETWLRQLTQVQLLLIFSYRSEEVSTSPCLRLLLDPELVPAGTCLLDLTPLSDHSVRELCGERLRSRSSAPTPLVERIVEQARGNPFLAQQLVALALAKQARGDADLSTLTVEELLSRTVALLSLEARALLHVLAIAGRPLGAGLALTAAEVLRDGRSHIHALQTLRLVRTRMVAGQRCLDVYHDRVREGVQAQLQASEREDVYARLLHVLERSQAVDPDWLHELAMGARQTALAYRYGLLAAERATSTLAFERAAELYARCLTLHADSIHASELWVKLGVALARCKRGAEAADAYLRAAELAPAAQQPPLLRFAASHLLRSGRFEEGEALVRRVLDLLGLEVPHSELGMVAAIGWERARIAMRGYNIKPHRDPEAAKRLIQSAELYGTIAVETQLHAPLRAALFQTRAMRLALESGDSATVARGLCLTGALVCVSGTSRAARQSAELFSLARELAKQCNNDDVAVEIATGPSLAAMFLGRPLEVIEHSDAANRAYAMKVAGGGFGDYFYRFAVNAARLGALQSLGRHIQAREELHDYLDRAQATGNRVAILQVTLTRTLAERSVDNCKSSRARLDAERAELPRGDFGILHLLHCVATMLAACSNREYDWALATVEQVWPVYLRSMLHGTAYLASVAHFSHARLLLGQHVATRSTQNIRRIIHRDVRALSNLPQSPYRDAVLSRLRARCAFLEGDTNTAISYLQESVKLLDSAAMLDEPERDRFALGCLIGGEEGAARCTAAVAALRELGALAPLEELESYYPELFAAGLAPSAS